MDLDAILRSAAANVAGSSPAPAVAATPPAPPSSNRTPAATPATAPAAGLTLDQLLAKPAPAGLPPGGPAAVATVPAAVAPGPVASPAAPDVSAALVGNPGAVVAPGGAVVPVPEGKPSGDWVSGEPAAVVTIPDFPAPLPGEPRTRGKRPGRDGDGEPMIGTLFVDCVPDGAACVYAGEIVRAALAELADGGMQDFRLVDFGKGKGLLAATAARRIRPADRVVLFTRSEGEAACLDAFCDAAASIVRGVR